MITLLMSADGIQSVIKEAMDKFILKKKIDPKKKKRAPLPPTVLEKIRAKRRLHKMWRKYRTKEN